MTFKSHFHGMQCCICREHCLIVQKHSEIGTSHLLIDLQCFGCEIGAMLCLELVNCYVVWIQIRNKRVDLSTYRNNQVDDTQSEEKTDTDKNMAIMFNILKQKKRVRLETLVLNRRSFAQTVENLFALSFLAKDGRVEIIVDKSGSHFACKILLQILLCLVLIFDSFQLYLIS